MANKHYDINDEIEVTIKVKVKNIKISNYNPLNEIQIADNVMDFKLEITKYLGLKLDDEYYNEEVTLGVDWWSFDVDYEE